MREVFALGDRLGLGHLAGDGVDHDLAELAGFLGVDRELELAVLGLELGRDRFAGGRGRGESVTQRDLGRGQGLGQLRVFLVGGFGRDRRGRQPSGQRHGQDR